MSRPSPVVLLLRRIFVLGVLALIIWGIISGIGWVVGLFGPHTATPTNIETNGQECAPNSVTGKAMVGDGTSEKLSFAPAEQPMLYFSLTNTGKVTCQFNGGPRVTFFTITSGTDQIWTSRDCDRAGLVDKFVTLKPGQTLEWPSNSWYRVRSSSTGCGSGQTPVLPGAYNLQVEVAGVLSGQQQFLLQ